MRSLSHQEDYEREELVAVLLGAGQFAHLSEEAIRNHLHKAVVYGGAETFSRYWNVPPIGGPERYGAGVVAWLGMVSVFCCLCGNIDRAPASGSPQLAKIVCPSWLAVSGPPRSEAYPWCRKCAYTISAMSGPLSRELCSGRFRWSFDNERDPELVLSLLLANPSFRGRVERYAPNLDHLRFDPRHEPQQVAA